MKKLISPMAGTIMKINVKEGQMITEDDEVIVIETMNLENGAPKELYEEEDFPRYQMLYEYFTCSYFTAV